MFILTSLRKAWFSESILARSWFWLFRVSSLVALALVCFIKGLFSTKLLRPDENGPKGWWCSPCSFRACWSACFFCLPKKKQENKQHEKFLWNLLPTFIIEKIRQHIRSRRCYIIKIAAKMREKILTLYINYPRLHYTCWKYASFGFKRLLQKQCIWLEW